MKIYYIGTEHCAQCKAARPKFEAEIKRLNLEAVSEVIDAEERMDLVTKYNVGTVPSIVIDKENGTRLRGHALDVLKNFEQYVSA